MFDFLRRRSAQRRSRIELSQLDAYLLRDIGLNPSDIRDPLDDYRTPSVFAGQRRRDR